MSRIIRLDQFSFHHTLEETPGVAIVIITGPDCGSCRMMRQALQSLLDDGAKFVVFEVDAETDMGIAREFGVFHLPSLFVFMNGVYHAPLEAEALPERILPALDAVLEAPAREAP
jgi:thiol-disulfide isomerase/thioredoxin